MTSSITASRAARRGQRQLVVEQQVGQNGGQVAEQRQLRPGAIDLARIQFGPHDVRPERGRADEHVTARIDDARRARHSLAALEAGQPRVDDEDPVLGGARTQDRVPAFDTFELTVSGETTARRRARNEQHARTLDRCDRGHDRVERVLADQQRHPAEARLEHLEPPPAREEPLLVEDAVRRQEHLAVHVRDAMAVRRDLEVERRVVVRPAGVLVETEGDVDRSVAGAARVPKACYLARDGLRVAREIVERALEEVARQGSLGQDDQVGRIVARELCERAPGVGEIGDAVALTRFGLDDRELHTAALTTLADSIAAAMISGGYVQISAIVGCRCGILRKS